MTNEVSNQQEQTQDREETCGAKGEREGVGGKDWEFGISKGKLLYIRWIKSKVLLLYAHIYKGTTFKVL